MRQWTHCASFNPYEEIRFTENLLPHWQQKGATYFITFRLADSIPTHLRTEWEEERKTWLRLHPEPWDPQTEQEYHRRFSAALEHWLDAGHDSCVLRQSECAKIVDETLRHFDGKCYALISSVVMPNHVHALLVQNPEYPLEKLLYSWKSFHVTVDQLFARTFRNFMAAELFRSPRAG